MDQELAERVRKLEEDLARAQNDKTRADEITAGLLRYILDHLNVESAAHVPEAQNRIRQQRLNVLELGESTLRLGLAQAQALNTRLLNILSYQASFSPRTLDEAFSGGASGAGGAVQQAIAVQDSGNGGVQVTSAPNNTPGPITAVEDDDEENLIDLGGEASRRFTQPLDGSSYVRYFNGGAGPAKSDDVPGLFDQLVSDGTDNSSEDAEFSQPGVVRPNTPADDFKPRRNDSGNGRGPRTTHQTANVVHRGRAAESGLRATSPGADSFEEEFYIYGIRFRPIRSTNVYRTVIITELPPVMTLSLLLARVRGGTVFSAALLNTRSITKSMSAMVVFMAETAARAFVDYTHRHPLLFLGTPARVALLDSPTWPIPKTIACLNPTRCIFAGPIPGKFSVSDILRDFEDKAFGRGTVENVRLDEHRTLKIRFSSVIAAVNAIKTIKPLPAYRGRFNVDFGPDPCSQPLPELPQLELELSE
ncbi:MAG: hypothetical protein M1823_004054 [Watsoniomyces obsoletus]|nr:MAG: hypothetical protein M1823_004054 [Watsoniomyces obsoletus]